MNKTEKNRFFKSSSESSEKINGLEDTIKSLENRLDENQMLEEEVSLLQKDYGLNSSSGTGESFGVVGEQLDLAMLQKLYNTEGWVYIAVWSIARTIATLPLKLEKRKVKKEIVTDENGKETDAIYRESWIEANAEPEFNILSYPNNTQLPVEFYMLILIDLLVTGNAYILVDKDADAVDVRRPNSRLEEVIRRIKPMRLKGMYRLNSALMEPRFDDKSLTLAGYSMQTADGIFEFTSDEVIHIRLPNPSDPILGLAPIVPVLKHVLIDRFTSEHMIRFYKQGARLGGVVKTTKKLTKEQISRLTRSFESNYTGKRNHHKTLILPEGMDYQTIEVNPGESSLIEFSKFNKEPILSAYGVPPVKVGLLDGATYANAVVQEKSFWENAVLPIKAIIECAINNSDLILRVERNLKFSFDISHIEVLQKSLKDRAETAQRMMQAGWSINEIRQEIWKKPPVEDGDLVPAIAKLQGAEAPFQHTAPIPGDTDEGKSMPDARQPDLVGMTDIEQTTVTYESRVAELTAINIQAGIPLGQSIASALEQARIEGFAPESQTPTNVDNDLEEPKKEEEEKVEGEEGKLEALDEKVEKFQNYCKVLTGSGVKGIIENKFEQVMEMFGRIEVAMMKEFRDVDFSDPEIVEEFTKSYDESKTKQDDDLPKIFQWIDKFLESEIERLKESEPDLKALEHGFDNTLSGHKVDFPNEKAQEFLEERGAEQVRNILETTRLQMRSVISRQYKEEVSPDEMADTLFQSFWNLAEGRAKTIARTETLTAVSQGQEIKIQETAEIIPNLRQQLRKRWITAQDSRVRDSHVFLDGEVVDDGENFDNGLKFPREPGSPAHEAINCRCAVVYFVEDDEGEVDSILGDNASFGFLEDVLF
jgi:HK97 family phage portal protein